MNGYVYIMSNEAMPGIYKIGCTSRSPEERANDLYTTGVPSPFIIEYCIIIENYQYIEKQTHKKLSAYNYNKEFFKCDLKKCILELKKVAYNQRPYKEKYRTQFLRAQVEDREKEYLQELEKRKKIEEENRRIEAERRRIESERINIENEKKKKEFEEKEKKSNIASRRFLISVGIGIFLSYNEHSFWPFIISVVIGYLLAHSAYEE